MIEVMNSFFSLAWKVKGASMQGVVEGAWTRFQSFVVSGLLATSMWHVG